MIFIIDNLKFDTDKMELISSLCRVSCSNLFGLSIKLLCKLYRSRKGNWIAVYGSGREAQYDYRRKKQRVFCYNMMCLCTKKSSGNLKKGSSHFVTVIGVLFDEEEKE